MQIPHFIAHDLTITASSIGKLKQIEETARAMNRTAKVHLKVDTGMERIGVHYYSAEPFIEEAIRCKHVEIEGMSISRIADGRIAEHWDFVDFSWIQLLGLS